MEVDPFSVFDQDNKSAARPVSLPVVNVVISGRNRINLLDMYENSAKKGKKLFIFLTISATAAGD